MKRLFVGLVAVAAAFAVTACAGDPAANLRTGLEIYGMSRDAYCSLAPEGRAEIRKSYGIPHLIQCPNDPPAAALPPIDPG